MSQISLIIPLYNAEKHLRACLDSVKNQTFSDFEAVLVNDGSSDNTLQIVDEYIKKYPNFRLISQKNGGVSAARNTGIQSSDAPFIAFLDQDDILHPQALDALYQLINHTHTDVAAFQIRFVPDDFAGDNNPETFDLEELTAKAAITHQPLSDFFKDKKGAPIYIWNKLYRRKAITGIEFPQNVQPAEDTVFTLKILLNINSMAVTPVQLLYYRENTASVTNQGITEKYIRSHAKAAEELFNCFRIQTKLNEANCERLEFYLSRFIFKSLISQPLRLIKGKKRKEQLDLAYSLALPLYEKGALKPEMLGMKKELACKMFINHHFYIARALV